jgi:hypothetical protein
MRTRVGAMRSHQALVKKETRVSAGGRCRAWMMNLASTWTIRLNIGAPMTGRFGRGIDDEDARHGGAADRLASVLFHDISTYKQKSPARE